MKSRVFNHVAGNKVTKYLVDFCMAEFDFASEITVNIFDAYITVLYIDSNGIACKWGAGYDVIEWGNGTYGVMYQDFKLIDTLV